MRVLPQDTPRATRFLVRVDLEVVVGVEVAEAVLDEEVSLLVAVEVALGEVLPMDTVAKPLHLESLHRAMLPL